MRRLQPAHLRQHRGVNAGLRAVAELKVDNAALFVEQDDSADPMRSIGISLKFLDGLRKAGLE